MKKYLALLLAVLMLTAMFAGCASKETTTDTPRRFYRNGRARQD